MGRLNLSQRIVIVIGLGAALWVFGGWVMTWGTSYPGDVGWTGYAPLSTSFYMPPVGGMHPWVRVVIWLALIAGWVTASTFVLRTRRERSSESDSSGDARRHSTS